MWNAKQSERLEQDTPGFFTRLRLAWDATRGLVATRKEMFQEELAQKKTVLAKGVASFVLALVFGWLAVLLLTALVAVLLGNLFGSLWAGILGAFVLYLVVAGIGAFVGMKAFANFRLFGFPETQKGLREDWETVRGALRTPPAASDGDETDLEQRFRAGSE